MEKHIFFLWLLFFCESTFAQPLVKPITVTTYYPKDSTAFNKAVPDFNFTGDALFGETLLLFHVESSFGEFDFVLKQKIKQATRSWYYENGVIQENLNVRTKKWERTKDSPLYRNMKGKAKDSTVDSQHDLYAFVFLHDHGGVVEKVKFQDFGNEVYWPEFDLAYCSVSDENRDGMPEFYLSYSGYSDGLDAKPFKQIIYTYNGAKKPFLKSKATAYHPAGNEEDVYHVEYDANWKLLPKAVQQKSNAILKADKERTVTE